MNLEKNTKNGRLGTVSIEKTNEQIQKRVT